MEQNETVYAGFWRRFFATIIDNIILMVVIGVLLQLTVGGNETYDDFRAIPLNIMLIQIFVPAILINFFWVKWMGTPGKLILKCYVVDKESLEAISIGQSILRYLGYIVSAFPLLLGFFWVAWDKKKQAFHDKIASTVVIVKK